MRIGEKLVEAGLALSAGLSVLITAGILAVLAVETFGFFSEVSLGAFLGDTVWTPLFADRHFGVWPLVGGTLLTTALAMMVAVPFGLGAAIYLSEFASPGVRRLLKPALEVLAGVPTIVYGYFALKFLTPQLQTFIPELSGFNALSAAIAMGVMIVPMVSSLSEDALYAVPRGLREGAWALGAGKVPTILRVVLPAAGSGILSSLVLAVSRAVGETMIVAVAAGQQAVFTADPRSSVQTLTAYIVQVSMGDVPAGTIEYRTIFAVGSTLFLMTFVMNLVARLLRRRPA